MNDCCVGDLRDKEVISTCDGARLGYVCDVEIDLCCGRLTAILVPGESKCFGFVRGKCLRIPWECIERIGDDIILVNVKGLRPEGDDACGDKKKCERPREKHRFFDPKC